MGIEEPALRALTKLARVLPRRLRERVRGTRDAIVSLPLFSEPASADVLVTLAEASRERTAVAFGYTAASGERTEREVEPHGLVHTGVRWYLVAWDRGREDWRTFRVDRFEGGLEPAGAFAPRPVPGGDLAAYVERSVTSAPYPVRAAVRIHAPLDRVASRVVAGSVRLEAAGSERCRLEAHGTSLEQLAAYFIGLGEELEVIEPPALKEVFEGLAARAARAAAP